MLLTISVTVIAAIMVIAVCFQIWVGLQIRRTAHETEKFMEMVRTQIVPLTQDISAISGEVRSILQSVHRQVENVEEGVATVKDAAVRLRDFQLGIQQKIEDPLIQVAVLAEAISHGVQAFVRIFRH